MTDSSAVISKLDFACAATSSDDVGAAAAFFNTSCLVKPRNARELGYELGAEFDISHGLVSASFAEHKNRPFRVVGVLARTGTPVDQTIHVSLEGIEAVHIGWNDGAPPTRRAAQLPIDEVDKRDLQPASITAFLVGLKSKSAVLRYQRDVNTFRAEAPTAAAAAAKTPYLRHVTT